MSIPMSHAHGINSKHSLSGMLSTGLDDQEAEEILSVAPHVPVNVRYHGGL